MFRKKALRINTYLGYGSETHFRATGRALEDENIDFYNNPSFFRILYNIYKQFESDEIRKSDIQIHLPNGKTFQTQTDEEGYYHINEEIKEFITHKDDQGWIPYSVSYLNPPVKKKITDNNTFPCAMMIPDQNAQYGIISDIDDTILHTGVASVLKWRLVVNTVFKNFDKRKATEGTASFYQKLQQGTTKRAINPFFYVSNSPWNLYDYLSAFFKKNNFPKGPILLRDFRTPFDKTPKPTIPHKRNEILSILDLYPNLNFILIGDSGEKDADIYTTIANQYPGRILAIYLRNVNHRKKEKRIQKIIEHFKEAPILLIDSIDQAIAHAKSIGLIG